MSSRRISVFLLGFWLGCILFMGWVATHNLGSVEPILKQSDRQLQREIKDIGYDRVKTLLRFEAAELNRHYFYHWEWIQLLLAVVATLVLLDATSGNKFTMVMMGGIILMLLVQHFLIEPEMIELGRGLDFAPADQMLDERRAFRTFHTYYSSIEAIKAVLIGLISVRMLLHGSSGKRRRRSGKVDVVDETDNCHVDRGFRAPDARHGAVAFGHQQDAISDAGIYRVKGHHGVASARAVQVERLNHQHLAPVVTRVLLRRTTSPITRPISICGPRAIVDDPNDRVV